MRTIIFSLFLLLTAGCRGQQVISFEIQQKNLIFKDHDSINVAMNYKNFKDTVFVSFSGERLQNADWREFDNDIRSDGNKSFSYFKIFGSGQMAFSFRAGELVEQLGDPGPEEKLRLVLNYHPRRFKSDTWYYKSIPGKEFTVVSK